MPAGAEIIAARLAAQGCRMAFGMPGGEVLALLDGLERAGIHFVLTKHENAAGFMAEGYWHRQSLESAAPIAPGILIATLGPGAANAVNVVANAYQDRVPLIFLTGRVDAAEAESYTHQVFDHQALFRPITKATLTASKGAVARVIDRAIAIAIEGQPGPVHVDVPISVAEGEEAGDLGFSRPQAGPMVAAGSGADEAHHVFRSSKRPLVIAGVDAVNHHASKAVLDFAERFRAPLITTYKAKGIIPEDHSLSLGGAGLSPKADKHLLPFLAEADCIVLAGYDPIEMRINWRDPFPAGVPVIELAASLPTHQMHRADHLLLGDIRGNLSVISTGIEAKPGIDAGKVSAVRTALRSSFAPEPEWGPGVVFETIRRLAPRDALATADSGAHRILLSQMWTTYAPRGLMQSSALCTMGCALPLAMGAQLASPEKIVIAFVGDAGLEMGIGELATARDLGLPVIVVVLQDERLALIDLKQRASGRKEIGVRFGATDFAVAGVAFGGAGVSVSDQAALEAAFTSALARRDTFTLIAAKIAPDAYEGRL